MKTPELSNQIRSRAWLLGMLVASAPLASVLAAERPDKAGPRKVPNRLPPVATAATENEDSVISSDVGTGQYAANFNVVSFQSPQNSTDDETTTERPQPTRWLRSTTSSANCEVARRLIAQASNEYATGAWLSAETSAWEALHWAAEAVDLETRENPSAVTSVATGAIEKLRLARNMIREARDFSGSYGILDAEAITRMARSHVTDVLDDQSTAGLTATDAADRYLDEARVLLAPIAVRSIEAAQTMDLLAAIYLTRADANTLPSATALCLRRAALQGQPQNASLASRLGMHLSDIGLNQEARWALEHSLSIQPNPQATEALVKVLRRMGQGDDAARLVVTAQNGVHERALAQTEAPRPKIPQITQLSPKEFASVSKSVMQASRKSEPVTASLVTAKTSVIQVPKDQNGPLDPLSPTNVTLPDKDSEPGMMRQFINSFKRFW